MVLQLTWTSSVNHNSCSYKNVIGGKDGTFLFQNSVSHYEELTYSVGEDVNINKKTEQPMPNLLWANKKCTFNLHSFILVMTYSNYFLAQCTGSHLLTGILNINARVFKMCPLRLVKLCLINGLFINALTQTLFFFFN